MDNDIKNVIEKEIPGFEEYTINTLGMISKYGKLILPIVREKHSPYVILRKNNKAYQFGVAKLVALTFIGEPNLSSDIVTFKDGDIFNLCVSNLEWSSRRVAYTNLCNKRLKEKDEAYINRINKIKAAVCRKVYCFKVSNDEIYKSYDSITDACKDLNVSRSSISHCLKYKNHRCADLYWRYVDEK